MKAGAWKLRFISSAVKNPALWAGFLTITNVLNKVTSYEYKKWF